MTVTRGFNSWNPNIQAVNYPNITENEHPEYIRARSILFTRVNVRHRKHTLKNTQTKLRRRFTKTRFS